MKPIYLDYAATTPLDPRVAVKMQSYLTNPDLFGNPASLHHYGHLAREGIDLARAQVAQYIAALPEEIIWTSGATEAINLAIKGAAMLHQRKGKHIVTMRTEHKATLDTCQHLEKMGYQVTYLLPEKSGLLNAENLASALREDTILVSIMHVNNETGVVQDLDAISNIVKKTKALLHVDAAQSPGKVRINVKKTPIDLLSLCAHKVYGPKGIGALYLRKKPRIRVEPLLHGGGHEQGMRSGTLATHQIVGMGEAFALAEAQFDEDVKRIATLSEYFLQHLQQMTPIQMNGENRVPHIMNVGFPSLIADSILQQLTLLAASTASACQGKGIEGSYVLRAMGRSNEEIKSAIRFSLGRFTTQEEIENILAALRKLFRK